MLVMFADDEFQFKVIVKVLFFNASIDVNIQVVKCNGKADVLVSSYS